MNSTEQVAQEICVARVVYQFYPFIGGSATHIQELSTKINSYLKDQIIIAPNLGDSCREFDENFGIKIIRTRVLSLKFIKRMPILPLIDLLYSISVYSTLTKMKRPDIIHAHGISNVVYCTLIGKMLGVPVVGMLHGSGAAYSKSADIYETVLAKLCNPNASIVLDDGSSSINKFKRLWGNKVTPVYHGIDTELYRPIDKNESLIDKLSIGPLSFIILSTSSLESVKSIDLAIKSFKLFLDKSASKNSYLLIAGHGPLKDSLINLSKELKVDNKVRFLGGLSLSEIIEYLSISDVVIATSLYSNMNRSVQEAMACEKPVIAFDSGTTRNLIKHMENGLLAKSGDIDSFVNNILLLYNNEELREKIGMNARKTIVTTRNWDERIKTELDIYRRVLMK
jgi:glycosyltransferase involved in cell wall biosynthesis